MSPTVPIGVVSPQITAGLGGGTPPNQFLVGVDPLWIHSEDPPIDVVARLAGKPSRAFPKPSYDTAGRPGAFGLTRYRGHDPYTMTVPLLLEAGGDSIVGAIRSLEQLAERAPGALEPPVVQVQGQGIPHQGLRWRLVLPDDAELTEYDVSGDPVRMYVTVTLTQHVTDTLLHETIRTGKGAKGLTKKRTTVQAGETSLYDVARRVFGDPFRAGDIVTANPGLRLATLLKPGRVLRLP